MTAHGDGEEAFFFKPIDFFSDTSHMEGGDLAKISPQLVEKKDNIFSDWALLFSSSFLWLFLCFSRLRVTPIPGLIKILPPMTNGVGRVHQANDGDVP